ncbi:MULTISPECIES: hypothetical protein [Bacillus cereus group]|uniref:hypothetical protein n=1 Tax=Bacillus cereus group TaxID=86661 RepID=UPI000D9911A7|nr:hypothetical protein [Bacillus cereus]MCU4949071.1 hypothetical protein [Bacillus cereus]SPT76379.1 Uncharacterised protein [Bacillus cereus]
MNYSLENQLIKYNALKSEWLHVVRKLDVCELEEQPLYQNIALEYANYFKQFDSVLNLKYGIHTKSNKQRE